MLFGPEGGDGGRERDLLDIHLCIHLHLLLSCVSKYTNSYDGVGLLALNGEVMFNMFV